jgi:hypothetical protein
MQKRLAKAIYYLAGLSLIYLLLGLILPINQQSQQLYGLSNSSYHVLLFALALPLFGIWFAAFFGYTKLRQYADSLKDTKEASAYGLLALGCTWLAWGLPTLSILTELANGLSNAHLNLTEATTIITNYAFILVPLIAFTILSNGSRKLLEQAKERLSASMAIFLVLVFVILGVIYGYLAFRPDNVLSMTHVSSPYYLPVWLVIITITIPSLYTWFIGLLAAGELASYSKKIYGLLYKKAVQFITVGLIAVISSSIAYQYIFSIDPHSRHLSLSYLLVSTYIIRIVEAVGFIAIAIGAIKLKRIEEV